MVENTPNTKNIPEETKENPQELPKIRPKLAKLCEEIIKGNTYAKAHKLAGYKGNTEQARYTAVTVMLRNDDVRQYLETRQAQELAKMQRETSATTIRTALELARIAYADPGRLFDDNGNLKKVADMDESMRRAIASIEVDIKGTEKIKLWNKNDALKTLSTYLGMLIERKEINGGLKVDIVYSDADKKEKG